MMIAAMVCALVALCLSLVSLSGASSPDASTEVADEVYQRILGEVRTELQPVYEDFGIKMGEASSFGELVRPLLGVQSAVSEGGGIENESPVTPDS
jgi:hypothetical protein